MVTHKAWVLLLCEAMNKKKPAAKKTTKPKKSKEIKLLADRIKKLRQDSGYTNYEYFAYENDIPRAQYGRYENGEDMRFSSLVKIIKAHGMTLKEFFSEGFDK